MNEHEAALLAARPYVYAEMQASDGQESLAAAKVVGMIDVVLSANKNTTIPVELKADEIDVISAALNIAALELDRTPWAVKWGGGDNMRRVRRAFFDAVKAAQGETTSEEEQ